ncbi:hypothetical protein K8B33_15070 [Alcanivorax sp. JB21]|uniref:hypothetical protein n=1 Tax=Alcanivorax limicola TaxID=2874102 RepID=UPI001CBC7B72|nr:hypothetical protein [Alcanivorax limicola]MBZ2190430.1 hypothetical protein [Alcanivorax limicola]
MRHASLGLLVCAIAACGGGGSGSGGGSSAQVCPEATGTYSVGDRGPAGGWIFYVDGDDSHDFDYLEAAPENITDNGGTTVLYTWASSYGGAFLIGSTSEAIGSGEGNTQRVADALTNDGQSNRAAQRTLAYEHHGCTWFLPSKDELNLMYVNLHQAGLGDFPGGFYWSSSEGAADGAWAQAMTIGAQQSQLKANANQIRAARAF